MNFEEAVRKEENNLIIRIDSEEDVNGNHAYIGPTKWHDEMLGYPIYEKIESRKESHPRIIARYSPAPPKPIQLNFWPSKPNRVDGIKPSLIPRVDEITKTKSRDDVAFNREWNRNRKEFLDDRAKIPFGEPGSKEAWKRRISKTRSL